MGITSGRKTIIVGAGYLGHALANHTNFKKRGFMLVGVFDNDKAKVGRKISDLTISDYDGIADFISENQPDIAILAVPRTAVKSVAENLISLGIKAIWNFAHLDLPDPDDVFVENVHLSESLMRLSYRVCSMLDRDEKNERTGSK